VNYRPPNIGDFSLSFRTLRSSDNASSIAGNPAPTADSSAKFATLNLTFSPLKRGVYSLNGGFNLSQSDTDNNLSRIFQKTQTYKVNSVLGVTERFGLDLNYEVSEPLTRRMARGATVNICMRSPASPGSTPASGFVN
jgi:hypothetical protein